MLRVNLVGLSDKDKVGEFSQKLEECLINAINQGVLAVGGRLNRHRVYVDISSSMVPLSCHGGRKVFISISGFSTADWRRPASLANNVEDSILKLLKQEGEECLKDFIEEVEIQCSVVKESLVVR